jgi:hypothetical protein
MSGGSASSTPRPGESCTGSYPRSANTPASDSGAIPGPTTTTTPGPGSPSDAASVTPAMATAAAVLRHDGGGGGGLFNLVALVGLLLMGAGAVTRRRVARRMTP